MKRIDKKAITSELTNKPVCDIKDDDFHFTVHQNVVITLEIFYLFVCSRVYLLVQHVFGNLYCRVKKKQKKKLTSDTPLRLGILSDYTTEIHVLISATHS